MYVSYLHDVVSYHKLQTPVHINRAQKKFTTHKHVSEMEWNYRYKRGWKETKVRLARTLWNHNKPAPFQRTTGLAMWKLNSAGADSHGAMVATSPGEKLPFEELDPATFIYILRKINKNCIDQSCTFWLQYAANRFCRLRLRPRPHCGSLQRSPSP